MIQINPLYLLLLVQFLLVFVALSIFFFLKMRKRAVPEKTLQEISELRAKVDEYREETQTKDAELQRWKQMCDDLKSKFEAIRSANEKLRESLASLFPEAEKSAEYKKMMESFAKNNKELDLCIDTLNGVNKELIAKTKSLKNETDKLSRRLDASVSKVEVDKLSSQKKSLEIKYTRLQEQLEDKEKQCEKLIKDYAWLEKEYNALYDNIEEKQNA